MSTSASPKYKSGVGEYGGAAGLADGRGAESPAATPVLPTIRGLQAAGRCLPSHGAPVGGDWIDMFTLHSAAVGLAVGDAAGNGVAAAPAMRLLRNALRAAAFAHPSPAITLDRLDRLVQAWRAPEIATAVYARLIPYRAGALMVFANAGHPPPLIRHPNGRVQVCDHGASLLLGAPPGPPSPTRAEVTVQLTPGTTVLLYTDGLVETRTRPLQTGLDQLVAAVGSAAPDMAPEELSDYLLAIMLPRDNDDDVALLTITISR